MRKEEALAWRDCAQGGGLGLEGLCTRRRPWPGGTVRKKAALTWRDCAQGSSLGLEELCARRRAWPGGTEGDQKEPQTGCPVPLMDRFVQNFWVE